ncbi:LacI family DNA-binding transcriptional regulator [Nocardia ninae]|uniref:LacI family transcriptional regulator n=2 Tax=Nocardia ninae TaxID=356145 RepID=A0A511MMB1_9NOCA|nr:LacI family transcriptional regulator [Nocardia ninae NBRC 108245]
MSGAQQRPRKVTSQDVARAVGVSQSAVSIALSNHWRGRLAAGTVDEIRQMAAKMHYTPNVAARNLRQGTGGLVFMLVPTLGNPMFAEIHAGASAEGVKHGRGLVVWPVPDGGSPAADALSGANGVIGCSLDPATLTRLANGQPTVAIDMDPAVDCPVVNADLGSGMHEALNYLKSLGHSSVLHFAGDPASWTFRRRSESFDEHSSALGIQGARIRVAPTVADAYRAANNLIAGYGSRTPWTAVVCDTDQIATGMYFAADRLGWKIPQQISVVSFENSDVAELLQPSLTSVSIPAKALGERAMQKLITLTAGGALEVDTLPTALIVRESASKSCTMGISLDATE